MTATIHPRPTDKPQFGVTAGAYAQHRLGFPTSMYDRWKAIGLLPDTNTLSVLDLGTGTGTLARHVASLGYTVTGADIDPAMLAEASRLASEQGLNVTFLHAGAEETGLPDSAFDMVTAGQCWHWFDRPKAASEAMRMLKGGGVLMICHFDWLPLPGSLVAMTEALILDYNPRWGAAGLNGTHTAWLNDLADGGFDDIQCFSYDEAAAYSPEAWVGRIEASAGIAALDSDTRTRFKSDLAERIARDYPGEMLAVPHRIFCVWGRKPVC